MKRRAKRRHACARIFRLLLVVGVGGGQPWLPCGLLVTRSLIRSVVKMATMDVENAKADTEKEEETMEVEAVDEKAAAE